MSTITFDSQSLIVDGRRTWLVSGAIHYARVPRELWRPRIRAAKQAGLNCIDTYVFWNLHEPQPGKFDFSGERDLRRFVEIVRDEGMYCTLRPGPFIGTGWDFAGHPAWLTTHGDLTLREASPPYLEACARYFGAVMAQVRDLQLTTPTEGLPPAVPTGNVPGDAAGGYLGGGRGPVIMMQVENEWLCHNNVQGQRYLGELVRYLRENGCMVPICNANNLWQRIDGTIDTWHASDNLMPDLRQLAIVQPDTPRFVSELPTGRLDHWGERRPRAIDADQLLERIAHALASGAQFNLMPFHGGTNFAFNAGQTLLGHDRYITTSHDVDAPLLEAGGRGEKYAAVKRIATFASQFHHVFANLTPGSAHVMPSPEADRHALAVAHQRGSQGDVVFIMRDEKDKRDTVDLLLHNGLTLTVPLGDDRAAWLLLQTNLGGVAQLEHTNLRPWAFLARQMLVLFGPAGAEGTVNLNGVELQITVPANKQPAIEKLDDLTVVVLNDKQIDATYACEAGLAVGCAGLDDDGEPMFAKGWQTMTFVSLDGELTTHRPTTPTRSVAPRLTSWQHASQQAIVDGSDDAFEKIDGPASLEQLGQNQGYGWYRIGIGAAKSAYALAPEAADRLHLFSQGKRLDILGRGPGATSGPSKLRLAGDVVVLADNLGRACDGAHLNPRKGLFGHIHQVNASRLPKPDITNERLPDPFEFVGYLPGMREGDRPSGDVIRWKFKPKGKRPYILHLSNLPGIALLLLNDTPIAFHHPEQSADAMQLVLQPGEGAMTGGVNTLTLALFTPLNASHKLDQIVTLYEVTQTLTNRGQWAFRPWGPPAEDAFADMPKTLPDQPAWFRARFNAKRTDAPLWCEPRGMSKGQIYLNGHNVGRYFLTTPEGKPVPPQRHHYLPEPWLHTDKPNELMLFDEHGKAPSQVRLAYNAMGPYHVS
ncbi:beta-galactosidase [Phycisphaerales bacterium AB-hyl4]|uniref:Beta-galactosidase n=1 Tax=Natronomicrosphaera hydrolytica TaxID=3242702 RepID=A0ABV4UBT0_9BACT